MLDKRLKIKLADYNKLKIAMDEILNQEPFLKKRYRDNGLSEMRYRWDVLHATSIRIGDGIGIMGDINLYAYMNDNQIDSALKHITKDRL